MQTGEENLTISLSEGQAQPQAPQAVPVATGEPLSEAEIEAILLRLPGLALEPEDQVDFNLPSDPIPPPRTGETIEEAFPPPAEGVAPETAPAGALEVLRFAPEGEISIAPFVSVSFNQPMVPLGTLADLAAEAVPVRIEPALEGTWRWLGTKTLTFEYASEFIDRLPKATAYRVSVPAGTKSAAGGELAETVEWSFSTPPPKMISAYPIDLPQPLEPLIFIDFDQRIDPAAVLATIQVRAGEQVVPVALATEEQIQADKVISQRVKHAQEGRWLAFRPQKALPAETPVSVVIGPGTPSAEGPLVTQETQSFGFHTYAPLRIEDHGCSWSDEECRPLTPFYIRFNNPIDLDAYQEGMLRIQPELPGVSVNIYDTLVNIQGATEGQTTYTVDVSGEIQDIFGQKLGKDTRLTFRVGSAEAMLFGSDKVFVTLDPAASKPVYSVYTINYTKLDLKIYAVQPQDWPDYQRYLGEYQRTDIPVAPPGRLVLEKSLPVESKSNSLVEVGIDLSEVMDGDYGHFIVIVTPPKGLFQPERYWQTVNSWVQVTQIGLDAFNDLTQMVAWTTALGDGTPLEGVSIEAGNLGALATTDEDGVARFAIPDGATYLVGRKGADQALLPRTSYYWGDDAWKRSDILDTLRWYVIDDRQMYRPGEQVHFKGWLRRIGGKQDGDVGLVGEAVSGVYYEVYDSLGNTLGNGRADVNALGGFDFVFNIPENTTLGYTQINFSPEGDLSGLGYSQHSHSFQVQEFRRPEFEVSARNETPGPYFAGSEAMVAVEAKYYAGGALPNAEVTWQVSSSPSNYSPPNWPDFIFGTWEPWWGWGMMFAEKAGGMWPSPEGTIYETFSGMTDASGTHYLSLNFDQFVAARPYSVLAEASVMDVNRQAWAATTALLVHPADLYVGMRSERTFVQRGEPLKIDLIVTDLDGNPVTDRPVQVQAARLEWKYQSGSWQEVEADTQTCTVGSQQEPVTCSFETPVGGTYRITATVRDGQDRLNQSQMTRWVSRRGTTAIPECGAGNGHPDPG